MVETTTVLWNESNEEWMELWLCLWLFFNDMQGLAVPLSQEELMYPKLI